MKQGELASRLSITQSALSRLEAGLVPMTVEQLRLIADVLGTTAASVIVQADEHAEKLSQRGIRISYRRDGGPNSPMVAGAALGALMVLLAGRDAR